jgi:hypothetical protein
MSPYLLFARSGWIVVAALTLVCAGCVVGPMEHGGRPPQPGEDLVTDLARATRNVAGAVRGVQYEEEVAPPEPLPPTEVKPLPIAEEPTAVAVAPVVEPPCPESEAVPFAEPVTLPPPRFFPVPTRPVFSSSNCDPWRVTF